jgi:hypothetical protein
VLQILVHLFRRETLLVDLYWSLWLVMLAMTVVVAVRTVVVAVRTMVVAMRTMVVAVRTMVVAVRTVRAAVVAVRTVMELGAIMIDGLQSRLARRSELLNVDNTLVFMLHLSIEMLAGTVAMARNLHVAAIALALMLQHLVVHLVLLLVHLVLHLVKLVELLGVFFRLLALVQ